MIKTIVLFLMLGLLAACATPSSKELIEPINVETLSKTTQSWDGSQLPVYSAGQPQVTILKITIQPGVTLKWHKHPVISAGVLMKGTLKVETEQQEVLQLKAGDTIVELVNKWHHGVNNGAEPAEIIVFYAGVKGSSLSIVRE